MGADGWIDIYDCELLKKAGVYEYILHTRTQPYEYTIFGKDVIIVYDDTEKSWSSIRDDDYYSCPEEFKTNKDKEKLLQECWIDTWEVWT